MEGIFVHLYRKADSEWIGQFRNALAAIKHVESLGENPDDYEIKFELSRYPRG
jgi:hypothetical protein